MARPTRPLVAGGVYHVYTRGVLRMRIFRDDRDRERFLGYLARCAARFMIEVRSYCLMGNHFHLHVYTPIANLADAMHWLLTVYALSFRRGGEEAGHVFESRYKAPLVEPGEIEISLSRYIHLNPVKAGIVERPEDYPWSSCRSYLGLAPAPEWLRPGAVLGQLGPGPRERIARYRRLADCGEADEEEGQERFERTVAVGSEEFRRRLEEARGIVVATDPVEPDLAAVLDVVAWEFGVDPAELTRNTRPVRREKLALTAVLVSLGRWNRRGLGEVLGRVSARSVSRYRVEAGAMLTGDEELRDRVEAILGRFGARLGVEFRGPGNGAVVRRARAVQA